MDLAKYRTLFLEEATEHLAEIGQALLVLEKDARAGEALDTVFRLMHSMKGMGASLGYDAVSLLAHRLEDRLGDWRAHGGVDDPGGVALLFRGLESLERMVAHVRETAEAPPADLALLAELGLPEPAKKSAAPAVIETAPEAGRVPAEAARANVPRPPPSIRVPNETLDRFLSTVGEVILTTGQLRTAAEGGGAHPRLSGGLDQMDRVVGELKRRALALRTTPMLRVMENLPRVAREVAQRCGKRVHVTLAGAELELDRSILDRLYDPLVHLVRNAVDHGLETPAERAAAGKAEAGRLRIEATREKDSILVAVIDDGRGMDLAALRDKAVAAGLLHRDLAEDLPPEEITELAFHPGLSTARAVSDISGRGVGMDAVRATLESLGGRVTLETRPGAGTIAVLRVPIAAAVQRVLLVELGRELVAVPISKVERVVEIDPAAIEASGGESFALLDDEPVLVLDLAARLGWEPASATAVQLVIADVRGERVALRVGRLAGQQDIYVKPLPLLLAGVRVLAGHTVLGDGRPVFLLDLNQLP